MRKAQQAKEEAIANAKHGDGGGSKGGGENANVEKVKQRWRRCKDELDDCQEAHHGHECSREEAERLRRILPEVLSDSGSKWENLQFGSVVNGVWGDYNKHDIYHQKDPDWEKDAQGYTTTTKGTVDNEGFTKHPIEGNEELKYDSSAPPKEGCEEKYLETRWNKWSKSWWEHRFGPYDTNTLKTPLLTTLPAFIAEGDKVITLDGVKEEENQEESIESEEHVKKEGKKSKSEPEYDKTLYHDDAVDEERIIGSTTEVILFTQQPEVKGGKTKRTKRQRLKKFAAKHTPFAAVETVIPTNFRDATRLSELTVERLKDHDALRWFWEKKYEIITSEECFHAFKGAYTHATLGDIYTNLATDCLDSRHLNKVQSKLLVGTTAVLRDVVTLYVGQYIGNHPLLRALRADVAKLNNTKTHIENQVIIAGLKARQAKPATDSTGGGSVDVPLTSSVFKDDSFLAPVSKSVQSTRGVERPNDKIHPMPDYEEQQLDDAIRAAERREAFERCAKDVASGIYSAAQTTASSTRGAVETATGTAKEMKRVNNEGWRNVDAAMQRKKAGLARAMSGVSAEIQAASTTIKQSFQKGGRTNHVSPRVPHSASEPSEAEWCSLLSTVTTTVLP
jgi:hypothetical protein